jgi:hypothetical protein
MLVCGMRIIAYLLTQVASVWGIWVLDDEQQIVFNFSLTMGVIK